MKVNLKKLLTNENNLEIKLKKLQKKFTKFKDEGLSRSEFILKDNEFYFLEINTVPGLIENILPNNNQTKQVYN